MKATVISLRILYPLWAIVGMFSLLYVPSQLVDFNDPLLTAKEIGANELLFRVGIMGSLVTQLLFILIAWLLGQLFNNTSKKAVQWMLILSFISVPMAMFNELNHVAALLNIADPSRMLFFLKLHQMGINIASFFWGLWLFPLGNLIYKSGAVPKWIGATVMIAGLGYFCAALIKIVFPNATALLPVFEACTFGEVLWMLWLTIVGTKKSWIPV
ncbi:MAG: DUF4386 domain-containing protein [Flavobacteriales bacterium]